MARTYYSAATHAIVGTMPDGKGGGVLQWHDNELDAHRDAKQMRSNGYLNVKVFPAPGGDTSAFNDQLHGMLADFVGCSPEVFKRDFNEAPAQTVPLVDDKPNNDFARDFTRGWDD